MGFYIGPGRSGWLISAAWGTGETHKLNEKAWRMKWQPLEGGQMMHDDTLEHCIADMILNMFKLPELHHMLSIALHFFLRCIEYWWVLYGLENQEPWRFPAATATQVHLAPKQPAPCPSLGCMRWLWWQVVWKDDSFFFQGDPVAFTAMLRVFLCCQHVQQCLCLWYVCRWSLSKTQEIYEIMYDVP